MNIDKIKKLELIFRTLAVLTIILCIITYAIDSMTVNIITLTLAIIGLVGLITVDKLQRRIREEDEEE